MTIAQKQTTGKRMSAARVSLQAYAGRTGAHVIYSLFGIGMQRVDA